MRDRNGDIEQANGALVFLMGRKAGKEETGVIIGWSAATQIPTGPGDAS